VIKCLQKIADLLTHCSSRKFSIPFIPGKASKAFDASILDDWKEDEVDWLKEVFLAGGGGGHLLGGGDLLA